MLQALAMNSYSNLYTPRAYNYSPKGAYGVSFGSDSEKKNKVLLWGSTVAAWILSCCLIGLAHCVKDNYQELTGLEQTVVDDASNVRNTLESLTGIIFPQDSYDDLFKDSESGNEEASVTLKSGTTINYNRENPDNPFIMITRPGQEDNPQFIPLKKLVEEARKQSTK